MYIYNITFNIDESIQKEWLEWIKDSFIPEMLLDETITKFVLSQIMVSEEMGGITYSLQFSVTTAQNLEELLKKDPKNIPFQSQRFSEKQVYFSTGMKVIAEENSSIK